MGRKRKAGTERISVTRRKQTGKNERAREDGAVMTYHVVPHKRVEADGLSAEEIVRARLKAQGWTTKETHSTVEKEDDTYVILLASPPLTEEQQLRRAKEAEVKDDA